MQREVDDFLATAMQSANAADNQDSCHTVEDVLSLARFGSKIYCSTLQDSARKMFSSNEQPLWISWTIFI